MRLHLTSVKYDFIEQKGHTKGGYDSYEKRDDKHVFNIISKRNDPFGFIFANLIIDPKAFPDTFNDANYHRYKKINNALYYYFTNDIKQFKDIRDAIKIIDGSSKILNLYLSGRLELETLVVLEHVYAVTSYWESRIKARFLFDDLFLLIRKYDSFIEIDDKKVMEIVKKSINNNDR